MGARLVNQDIKEIDKEIVLYNQSGSSFALLELVNKINELVITVNGLSKVVNEYEIERVRKEKIARNEGM